MKTLTLAVILCAPAVTQAAELDFYRDVYPFLKANCISCHNKTTTKADLNMETPALMITGGEGGPAIVPGKSADSLIVAASLHTQDMEMPPPNNKSGAVNLTSEEIAILKQWIDQGAKDSEKSERAVALKAFSASVAPIYCVAVSKDGRYAACGRSNRIFVYDLATRQLAAEIRDSSEPGGAAHRALVQSLAFSPDGQHLASGSFREVKLWRMETSNPAVNPAPASSPPVGGELLKKVEQAGKVSVISSAMSADGSQIVTGCADGTVRVWDAATAKPVIELRGSMSAAKRMAELEWISAAQELEQSFQKAETTRIETQDKALDVLLGKAREAIVAMKKVLPEKNKAVPTATNAKNLAQKKVDELLTTIAAASAGETADKLKAELATAQDKLITASTVEVSALAAVSATEGNVKDAEDDVKRIAGSKAKNASVLAAANAAKTTAKVAQDKAAAELAALKQALPKSVERAAAVAFSQDGQRVAAMFDDGTLRVWAVATGTPIDEVNGNAPETTTLVSGAGGSFIHTKSLSIATAANPHWVMERRMNEKGLFADRVNAVKFSPDGKTLAAGGGELSRSGDIHFFDTASGKLKQTWKEHHADAVLSLDFSPDGKFLASGAADKIARVAEISSGRQVNLFEGHTHHVTGIAYRSDGRVLATAGADGIVVSWDMITGERKKKIEGWTNEVTSLQFIGATNQMITSSGDNRVRVVTDEGAEIRNIANLPDFMQSSASTPNGAVLIGGGEDSLLRVWDAAGKELVVFGAK